MGVNSSDRYQTHARCTETLPNGKRCTENAGQHTCTYDALRAARLWDEPIEMTDRVDAVVNHLAQETGLNAGIIAKIIGYAVANLPPAVAVQCNHCGKGVSGMDGGQLIVRAHVECPECIQAGPGMLRERVLELARLKSLNGQAFSLAVQRSNKGMATNWPGEMRGRILEKLYHEGIQLRDALYAAVIALDKFNAKY